MKGELEEHVATTAFATLADLAFVSGVEHQVLTRISRGEIAPSQAHRKAILAQLPGLDPKALDRHSTPEPKMVTVPRGSMPPGTELLVVPALDLLVGDYVSYMPPRKLPGSHWVLVTAPPVRASFIAVLELGGIESHARDKQPVRIARRTSARL